MNAVTTTAITTQHKALQLVLWEGVCLCGVFCTNSTAPKSTPLPLMWSDETNIGETMPPPPPKQRPRRTAQQQRGDEAAAPQSQSTSGSTAGEREHGNARATRTARRIGRGAGRGATQSPGGAQSPLPPAVSPLVSPQMLARAGWYTPPRRAPVRWDAQPPLFSDLRALLWRAAEAAVVSNSGGGHDAHGQPVPGGEGTQGAVGRGVFEADCVAAPHPLYALAP